MGQHIFDTGVTQRLEAVHRPPEIVEQRRITIEPLASSLQGARP
jgi:hypothetical protein